MKLSFIIPCFNAEKTLRPCVNSIEQTCTIPYEIIIVNDGSTDGTGILAYSLSLKNKSVKVLNCINQGVNYARRNGWSIASGEFVCFVDADDRVCLNQGILEWLDKQYDIIKASGYYIHNAKKVRYSNVYSGEIDGVQQACSLLIEGKILPFVHSAFYRKEAIDASCFDFDPRFIIGEDLLFNFKLMSSQLRIMSIDNAFYLYSMNMESVMHTKIWGFNYVCAFNDEIEKIVLPLCPDLKQKLTEHRFKDYIYTLMLPEVKMKHSYYLVIKQMLNAFPYLRNLTFTKVVRFVDNEWIFWVYIKTIRLARAIRNVKKRTIIELK